MVEQQVARLLEPAVHCEDRQAGQDAGHVVVEAGRAAALLAYIC